MNGLTMLPVCRKPLCWRISAQISKSIPIAWGLQRPFTGKDGAGMNHPQIR